MIYGIRTLPKISKIRRRVSADEFLTVIIRGRLVFLEILRKLYPLGGLAEKLLYKKLIFLFPLIYIS